MPSILLKFRPWLIALAFGLCWGLCTPKTIWSGLAWVVPALSLGAVLGQSPAGALRLGWVGGFLAQLIALRWLLNIPYPSGAIIGWIALSAYVALYHAFWLWLMVRTLPQLSAPDPATQWLAVGRATRLGWALLAAAYWVGGEIFLARFLGGFPWTTLGVTQYELIPIIQIADITGVYGVSFLMVWFSVSAFSAGLVATRQPLKQRTWMWEMIPVLAALVLCMLHGFRQMSTRTVPDRSLRLALVQPSIPQTLIWDERENGNRFDKLLNLSELALATKPDLLIWPEASVPKMVRHDLATGKAIAELVQKHKVWAVVGSDDAIRVGPGQTAADYRFHNAAMLIDPDGFIRATYNKRNLVIFGEYIPLLKYLPFLKYFTPIGETGFSPGEGPGIFSVPSIRARFGVLICYEDIFPNLAPDSVDDDTDFLLNITNNGWFGEAQAQWQHAALSIFRAIENRRPLVRCSNNGLTCWVDTLGRLHNTTFGTSDDIYGEGFKIVEIPLPPASQHQTTFYHAHPDWFAHCCLALTAAITARTLWKSRKLKKRAPVGA